MAAALPYPVRVDASRRGPLPPLADVARGNAAGRQGYQPQAGNELATALPGGRDGTVSPEGGAGAAVLSMDVAAALAALGSSRRGLDEAEAARRRASGAPNTLPRPRRRPVAAELVAQLASMFAVVLMVAAGLTFLIYFVLAA